jgi:hypothetical protein
MFYLTEMNKDITNGPPLAPVASQINPVQFPSHIS